MPERIQDNQESLEIEQLTKRGFAWQLIHGIAVTLGLSLLWSLEAVRNVFFRALDRMNVRPRPRRASAFPPGRPRKRTTVDAHR
jgi:hypothetical protein